MGTSGIDPLTFPQNMSPIAQTICLGHQINRRAIYLYSEYGKGTEKRNFVRVDRFGPNFVGGSGIDPITIPENMSRVAQTIRQPQNTIFIQGRCHAYYGVIWQRA